MDGTLEIARDGGNKSNETPFGVSWHDLIQSLRPSSDDERRLNKIKDTVYNALSSDEGVKPDKLEIGGAYGSGTLSRNHLNLQLYAVYENDRFYPDNYIDEHLEKMTKIIKQLNPQPQSIVQKGFAVTFVVDDIPTSLYAAGELYAGPAQLVYSSNYIQRDLNYERKYVNETDSRTVYSDTTVALLRSQVLRTQSMVYKDMVRVVRKWMNEQSELNSIHNRPGELLIHLLVLAAVRSSTLMFKPLTPSKFNNFNNNNLNKPFKPYYNIEDKIENKKKAMKIINDRKVNNESIDAKLSIDTYKDIFRKFFHISSVSDTQHGDIIYSDSTPSSMSSLFLWWPILYDRPLLDYCIATGQLKLSNDNSNNKLLIIDIVVPFINVSNTLKDWSVFRTLARQMAIQIERKNTIQTLQDKLQGLTQGFQESIQTLTLQIQNLQFIENSPRRFIGTIQFSESHMNSEHWVKVMDIKLRTITWRINARKAKADGVGYNSIIDLALQMVDGKETLNRPLDVDVIFRTTTIYLTFDKDNDHVFMQKRSEVIRNRDYNLQVTVVG